MSSPRCRIVGFDASDVGEIWEREDGMVEGGAGRPESCGVGVAADIIMVRVAMLLTRRWGGVWNLRRDNAQRTRPKFRELRMKLVKVSSDASSDATPRVLPNQNKV
jgi:hypothetical protein